MVGACGSAPAHGHRCLPLLAPLCSAQRLFPHELCWCIFFIFGGPVLLSQQPEGGKRCVPAVVRVRRRRTRVRGRSLETQPAAGTLCIECNSAGWTAQSSQLYVVIAASTCMPQPARRFGPLSTGTTVAPAPRCGEPRQLTADKKSPPASAFTALLALLSCDEDFLPCTGHVSSTAAKPVPVLPPRVPSAALRVRVGPHSSCAAIQRHSSRAEPHQPARGSRTPCRSHGWPSRSRETLSRRR